MSRLFLRWLAAALAITITAYVLPGIDAGPGLQGFRNAMVAALFLGFFNAVVRPVVIFLSCPLILATLGFFLLVINATMLLWASAWLRFLGLSFSVDGLSAAIMGSILITILHFVFSGLLQAASGHNEKEGQE